MNIVGTITFGNKILNVYSSVDEPLKEKRNGDI